jgi:methanogenic corrinoid protein MtbC1
MIRRLMDRGWRPGGIVGLKESELVKLANQVGEEVPAETEGLRRLLEAVQTHDIDLLYSSLAEAQDRMGMRRLVLELLAPAARVVGERWAAGDLQIFEEHLFTRAVTRFLDGATSRAGRAAARPSVLLATLPGEPHGLGLLMVEALLREKGRPTLNLGVEVPLEQLAEATLETAIETVALSFSSSYPYAQIRQNLVELRSRIPVDTEIWVGGAGVQRLKRLPAGVSRKDLAAL